jgi:aminopeptidase YwaD
MNMNRNRVILSLFFVCTVVSSYSQKLKKADKAIISNLQAHIGYLADDKLEGRRAGSQGEKLAREYIAKNFKQTGLIPKGTDNYFQPFEINDGKQYTNGSYFIVNNNTLSTDDFFPFPFSAEKKVEASPSIALQEMDMPWFIDLKDILEENKQNPHFDLEEYIKKNAQKAIDKGTTAIIIYNSSGDNDGLSFKPKDPSPSLAVPVIYVKKSAADKYFKDQTATLNIRINVAFSQMKRTGHNVVGYIDNGAPTTVVFGAHFDHLGYGEDGNSMLRTGERLIHNGADDNASGTAALLELAALMKKSKAKNNNYLFIAFSGEELGLFGSKHYVDNPTIDLGTVNYMINMDMVGRLNDSTKMLTIGGYGTSPVWSSVINPNDKKLAFAIHVDSSGSGPSDHTSFYRKDIPVLFFFTGTHTDYHRPSDDADRINYTGELFIINYINELVNKLNKQSQKLAFLKTREQQTTTTSFKVTLGVMPDYTYSGVGLRADGVTEGRPAALAGIKAGDIIIQLGDNVINSMDSYMQALNKFNKGDKTTVKYKRGNETLEAELRF